VKQDEVPVATEAEREQERRRQAVSTETSGMHAAFTALQPLDGHARRRALRWLAEALDDIEVPF
jgi:hypothetical protein